LNAGQSYKFEDITGSIPPVVSLLSIFKTFSFSKPEAVATVATVMSWVEMEATVERSQSDKDNLETECN
jgi:hypothetical protein